MKPFANAWEFMDWMNRHCCRCAKYPTDDHSDCGGGIMRQLSLQEDDPLDENGECPEFEEVPE